MDLLARQAGAGVRDGGLRIGLRRARRLDRALAARQPVGERLHRLVAGQQAGRHLAFPHQCRAGVAQRRRRQIGAPDPRHQLLVRGVDRPAAQTGDDLEGAAHAGSIPRKR
jgi:hypothetical protein